MVLRLSALRPGRFLPQEIFLVLVSVRGWINPKTTVRSGGLWQWKISMILSGIERATIRFVAQHLNHCATAVRLYVPTVLQNGLQISCAKKCFIIWCLHGTEVAQTNYLVFITCGMWKGKRVFFRKLTAFCPKNNNSSQSWPTVHLSVPLQWLCMYRTAGTALE